MKDSELNKLLRSVQPPERSPEEKAEFPGKVVRQLSRPVHQRAKEDAPSSRLPMWAAGFATVCLAIGFIAGRFPEKPAAPAHGAVAATPDYAKLFKEVATLFPDRLRGVVVRGSEMELVLAEQPERPATNPLLVEICQNGKCKVVITFSGQKLEVDGHSIEVFTGADDRLIVLADNQVWTSQNPSQVVDGFRIHAEVLHAQL
ncbi:MAG TPA: hypothetical protein VGH19_11390 [Verrucomicrobiae bacterium]